MGTRSFRRNAPYTARVSGHKNRRKVPDLKWKQQNVASIFYTSTKKENFLTFFIFSIEKAFLLRYHILVELYQMGEFHFSL